MLRCQSRQYVWTLVLIKGALIMRLRFVYVRMCMIVHARMCMSHINEIKLHVDFSMDFSTALTFMILLGRRSIYIIL
jgi:hypothetical protein